MTRKNGRDGATNRGRNAADSAPNDPPFFVDFLCHPTTNVVVRASRIISLKSNQ